MSEKIVMKVNVLNIVILLILYINNKLVQLKNNLYICSINKKL